MKKNQGGGQDVATDNPDRKEHLRTLRKNDETRSKGWRRGFVDIEKGPKEIKKKSTKNVE